MKFDLEWAFGTYSDSFLQDMLVVAKELNNLGITMSDFIDYGLREFSERRSEAEYWRASNENRQKLFFEKSRRCGQCGKTMALATVNDNPGSMVGGAYRSMWYCRDQFGCGEVLYSDRVIHEEAEAHGLGDFFPDPKKTPTTAEYRRRWGKRMRTKHTRPNNPRPPSQCGGCR